MISNERYTKVFSCLNDAKRSFFESSNKRISVNTWSFSVLKVSLKQSNELPLSGTFGFCGVCLVIIAVEKYTQAFQEHRIT